MVFNQTNRIVIYLNLIKQVLFLMQSIFLVFWKILKYWNYLSQIL